MIEIKNLSKSYKKGKKIIDNMNIKINDGEILGFLGRNGVGKTTTIKMITGILDIDEGEILIDGISIQKQPVEAKRNFGYVSDSPDMFLKMKAIDYLNFIADIYDVSIEDRKKRIEKFSKIFEISDVLNQKIENFSHGMRQKIMIISALIHEPQNLIIDEPMIGLDPKSSYQLKLIMKEYAKNNKTVFFSTHILDVAEKLCDRLAVIKDGKIVYNGTYLEMKSELKEDKSLEELFMEITEND